MLHPRVSISILLRYRHVSHRHPTASMPTYDTDGLPTYDTDAFMCLGMIVLAR